MDSTYTEAMLQGYFNEPMTRYQREIGTATLHLLGAILERGAFTGLTIECKLPSSLRYAVSLFSKGLRRSHPTIELSLRYNKDGNALLTLFENSGHSLPHSDAV